MSSQADVLEADQQVAGRRSAQAMATLAVAWVNAGGVDQAAHDRG